MCSIWSMANHAIVESPTGAFPPLEIHYGETFIVPARCRPVHHPPGTLRHRAHGHDESLRTGDSRSCLIPRSMSASAIAISRSATLPAPPAPHPSSAPSTLSAPACSTRIAPARSGLRHRHGCRSRAGRRQPQAAHAALRHRRLCGRASRQKPTRSQGHVHAIAPHSGWSPPEVFQILEGRAIVYAQQSTEDDPGLCIAVSAGPGEKSLCRRSGRTASSTQTHPRAWFSRRGVTASTALSTTACANTAAWPGSRCSTRATASTGSAIRHITNRS